LDFFQNRRTAHFALHRDWGDDFGVIRHARHLSAIVSILTSSHAMKNFLLVTNNEKTIAFLSETSQI
jgi:hypothetical protein